jgi:hypothetical protein
VRVLLLLLLLLLLAGRRQRRERFATLALGVGSAGVFRRAPLLVGVEKVHRRGRESCGCRFERRPLVRQEAAVARSRSSSRSRSGSGSGRGPRRRRLFQRLAGGVAHASLVRAVVVSVSRWRRAREALRRRAVRARGDQRRASATAARGEEAVRGLGRGGGERERPRGGGGGRARASVGERKGRVAGVLSVVVESVRWGLLRVYRGCSARIQVGGSE